MALWQYRFYLLPKSEKIVNNFRLKRDDDGLFDDAPFWIGKKTPPSFFDDIGRIFPKGKSWSKDIDLYGEQDGNCFEVLFEDGIAVSVSFRIDFRSHYELFVRALIDFFIAKELIVLDQELKIVPLNIESFQKIIDNAPQVKKYDRLSRRQT